MSKKKIKLKNPATPEQMGKIESMLGQSLDDFAKNFSDDKKRKIFASSLAKQLKTQEHLSTLSSGTGRYQPIFSEQAFQDININPTAATSSEIETWLLSPQFYDQNLRHLSQYLSYSVGQYQRSIYHLNTIKSFNYTLLPSDGCIEDDINTDEYLHAYNICLRTLQKMNIKYQMPKVDLQTMIDGVSFFWVDETSDTISLLPLPTDYCYITSPWTYGFLFAIDLVFFDKYISVPQQIPELYKAYETFCKMRTDLYKGEDLAPYQYFQVPPGNGWVFTFNPSMPDKLPPLTPSMAPALDTISYRELLKNKMALDLFKVIAMKIPLDKDNKQMAIDYPLAEQITQVIQSLLPDNIKAYSSPFESESITTDQSSRFDQIVDISNNTYYASAGMSAGLFGNSETKQGTALQLSANIDFNFASANMYPQYSNFINFQLTQKTKKYKFQTRFFGNKLNEIKETEMYASLVATTNSHLLEFFASTGREPFQVKSTLLLEDKLGLRDFMKPIVSAFNSKANGRPEKNDSDLSDGGEITRDQSSNEQRFSLRNCLNCDKKLINSNSTEGAFCSESCKEEYCENAIGK